MAVYVGTSGFKFADWKEAFYPAGVPEKSWLNYYATVFGCLEVNSTYYRPLPPATFAQMAAKVPAGFQFTVKAYQSITHQSDTDNAADFATFVESLNPLVEAGKLGGVLAQFPNSFRPTPATCDYLARLRERLAGLPVAVEFRHRDWARKETFPLLCRLDLAYCAVDEPQFSSLMPPLSVATSALGYVRFHGRNYQTWWQGDSKRRYDYLYSRPELEEWVPRIVRLDDETGKVFVFMNNCFGAQAAKNAVDIRDLLKERLAPRPSPSP